ncbi:MAG: hypothetical protein JW958_07015 [Candidatus Eisenbacteria bacterium]|nr:hypothetical protein [Candidatus Eisenbacteria bacterium]
MKVLVGMLAFVLLLSVSGCGDDDDSPTGNDATHLTASLIAAPSSGTVLTDFSFNASGSDAGSASIRFRWDWENDGAWDTDWADDAVVTHRYASGDTIAVAVEARAGSLLDTAYAVVYLNDDHGARVDSVVLRDGGANGMTNDGEALWITGWMEDIYKVDVALGVIVDTIDGLSNWTGAITWDGDNLWATDFDGGPKLFERDPLTGETYGSFDIAYSAAAGGVAWDGEAFYVGSDLNSLGDRGDGLIHRYLPDGTETGAIPSPRGSEHPRGLAFDGEDLWVVIVSDIGGAVDTLYVVDKDDGTVLRTLYHQGLSGDMTVMDDHVWVVTSACPCRAVKVVP